MQARRELIEHGQTKFWRLFGRPVSDDERVTLSPPIVDLKEASSATWPSLVGEPTHGDGQLWVTDRRALVSNRKNVLGQWSWSDLVDVRAIPGFLGVVLTPRDSATVVVLRQVAKDTAVMAKDSAQVRWLTVEATYAAAIGELDSWYDALPSRLSRG
jgi:hypothetical protein